MEYTRLKSAIRATIVNATVNTLLAVGKVVFGIIGHSQALVADGLHSFSDLITDALVMIAAKMGDQNPDKEHPYGHRRIETIGAIIISLVLIFVAGSIIYEAVLNIADATRTETPTWATVVVAVISIIANEGLFRYTLFEGNKSNSDLLRTNAWHNRSDVLTSVIVLVAVLGSILGIPYLDAIGAFIIAILIFKVGLGLIRQGVEELIDTSVDEETLQKIEKQIKKTPGVVSVHRLRTRLHGGSILVDVHIQVDPAISVSEGHFIGEQVHLGLVENLENVADVTVHIDPEDDETSMPSINLPHRKTVEKALDATWSKLPYYDQIQKISLHYLAGKITAEVVLPMSLLEKYDKNKIEGELKTSAEHLNYIKHVLVHYK